MGEWVLRNSGVSWVALGTLALEAIIFTAVLYGLRRRIIEQTRRLSEQQEQLEERAAALEEHAVKLEQRTVEAQTLAQQLETVNRELGEAFAVVERARKALVGERRFLRQVIDINPNFVFAKDRDGRFTLVNQAVADAYGTTIDGLVGKMDADFNSNSEEVEGFRRADLEVMNSGATRLIAEEAVTDAAGAVRWLQTVKCPIFGESGRAEQVLGVSTDITQRKQLEAQLLQSQKMEAVGRLAGGIAHDFNNLLTVITSYSDLALATLSTENPLHRDIGEIRSAADRATRLTAQLLAFSRKQVMRPRVLDLTVVVSEMERMLRPLIGEDVELHLVGEAGTALVNADPGQIEQVIMNLAVNARDAMPSGGRLTIETSTVELGADDSARRLGVPPGSYVMLAVTDTGCGMGPDTLAHLFEPFFTTKGAGKGTGLGLSTVYGIVKQSGGDLWVYSEPLLGSTFKVYLPRVKGEHSPSRWIPEQGVAAAPSQQTVLLVEDDQALRKLGQRILRLAGYIVLDAGDGQEAIAICEQHKGVIDLVATDVVMPGISGRVLAERIATLRPAAKVLFMSGYTDDDVVRRGIADPSRAFLQKPFTPDLLRRKVREALLGLG